MKDEEIRKKYQRDEGNDLISTNVGAVNRFIEMIHVHERSKDSGIRSIAENFEQIGKIAPNFKIFQGDKCFFLHNFKAYQISENTNMILASHEFGHGVLSIINDTKVPEDYGNVIGRAKQHAISPENKGKFKEYIQYISGKTDRKEERTEAEEGPVSDIISSIFQRQGIRIDTPDNVCMFPSSHSREYYYDEERNQPNLKNIFDEDFANYYSLKANNCTQEIETIRNLFGDEFINTLDSELEKISERLIAIKETEEDKSLNDSMEQIKGSITTTRQSEIQGINSLEKVVEADDKIIEETGDEISE